MTEKLFIGTLNKNQNENNFVSAELGIGTLRMSRLKTAKLYREHSDSGGSSAIVFIYLHATRHTAERRYLYYTPNGYKVPMEFRVYLFPRIRGFSRRATMHLKGMLLIETEFCKIIVPL